MKGCDELLGIQDTLKARQKHGFPCSAETDLFDAAILAHPEKIIVKRLLKSECLAGREPY